jgi:hypothetical protein
MNRVRRPALRGTWLGTLLRLLGPLVMAILRSPVHWLLSRWLCLFRWTNPGTGKQRTLPLSYIREDRLAYLTTGDRWSRQLGEEADVTIRLRGRWQTGRVAVLADREEAATALGRLFRDHPWFRILSGIPAAPRGAGADADALRKAISAGRVLIRVSLPA